MALQGIRVEGICKSFGGKQVLRGVDLSIGESESVVIIGGSGSGKSVLMKHMIGLLRPDAGSVYVDDVDISGLGERGLRDVRRRFGMLFQGAALFDSMTVGDNVGFVLSRDRGLDSAEVREIVAEKLRMVGLEGIEGLMPSELSGGMKKRVGLARAIAHDPSVILYDEPTTGLDPVMADAINDLIIELGEKLKVTSVTITHDMHSAYKIADRIAMLHEGRIIEEGSPAEIRASQTPEVHRFVRGSAI